MILLSIVFWQICLYHLGLDLGQAGVIEDDSMQLIQGPQPNEYLNTLTASSALDLSIFEQPQQATPSSLLARPLPNGNSSILEIEFGNNQAETIIKRTYSLRLINYMNIEWYANVYMGTPKQAFGLEIDTGSSHFWLNSLHCSSSFCKQHRQFNGTNSDTYRSSNVSDTILVNGGIISGHYSSDTATFVEYTNTNGAAVMQLNSSIFVEVDSMDGNAFSQMRADGLLGLNVFGEHEEIVPNKLFQSMLPYLKEPMFSLYLERDQNKYPGGELLLGGVNETLAKKERMVYMPLVKDSSSSNEEVGIVTSWQVEFSSIEARWPNGTTQAVCTQNCRAVIDTSYPLVAGPVQQVDTWNKLIGCHQQASSSSDCLFVDTNGGNNCDTVKSRLHLPDLVFLANDNSTSLLSLKPDDYIQRLFASDKFCLSSVGKSNSESSGSTGINDSWTLGALFVGAHYTVFDFGQRQIGFLARAAEAAS